MVGQVITCVLHVITWPTISQNCRSGYAPPEKQKREKKTSFTTEPLHKFYYPERSPNIKLTGEKKIHVTVVTRHLQPGHH